MNVIKMIFSSIGWLFRVFWKYFRKFQSVVGTLLFMLLVLFIGVSMFKGDKITVPEYGALVVSLEGVIQEQKIYNDSPLQAVAGGKPQKQTILRDVIKSIDLAAEDDRITLLIIDTNKMAGALPSKLHYIGDAMSRFRQSGKKIVTYGDSFSQSGYLIASYADEIYLHPYGAILLDGYGSYQSYFKGFLDKIKAEMQLFRVGKYKSAMEPFIRSDMSPAAKEANLALIGDLWAEYTQNVEQQRDLIANSLMSDFDRVDVDLVNLKGDMAALAMQYGLVDGLKNRAEWREFLAEELGAESAELKNKTIGYHAYLAANAHRGLPTKEIIAVVYVNGTIMDGHQPQGTAGGETVSRHLREARLNDKVKAIVLRVDSPGGSVFASELIRQEVLLLKKAGKPVVTSMGSVAASGGYWVAANTDEIWASATTITGSIGVFGAIPNFEGTMAAIGITTDGVGTTPLSGTGVSRPLPEKVKVIVQSSVENIYDKFLKIISEGRNMTVEQVNEVGQGRVWTGSRALELGLVDKIGSFEDAVASAAARAEITDYRIAFWEDKVPWEMKLIADIIERNAAVGAMLLAKTTSPQDILAAKILDSLSIFGQLNDPNHAYVLCLSCRDMIGSRK